MTLHSFAGVGLGEQAAAELLQKVQRNKGAVKRWRAAKVLVIDEGQSTHLTIITSIEVLSRSVHVRGRPIRQAFLYRADNKRRKQ